MAAMQVSVGRGSGLCCGSSNRDVCRPVRCNVESFGGSDLPEHWQFHGVSVSLDGSTTIDLARMEVRHTVDRRDDMTIGALGLLLREAVQRSGCLPAGATTHCHTIESGEEGFMIAVEGVKVSIPYKAQLGSAVECLAIHVGALVEMMTSLQVPDWHRRDDEHFSHFFK